MKIPKKAIKLEEKSELSNFEGCILFDGSATIRIPSECTPKFVDAMKERRQLGEYLRDNFLSNLSSLLYDDIRIECLEMRDIKGMPDEAIAALRRIDDMCKVEYE